MMHWLKASQNFNESCLQELRSGDRCAMTFTLSEPMVQLQLGF